VALPFSPASERNKKPIFNVLNSLLPNGSRVLEIGSGNGQHATYFAWQRPDLDWLATEVAVRLPDLKQGIQLSEHEQNVQVEALSVDQNRWEFGLFDAVFTANTLHIMPWSNTDWLIKHAADSLKQDGLLICYGPFQEGGRHNADSNLEFDQNLRARDPEMGIRDLVKIRAIGEKYSLLVSSEISMPANNRMLVFKRT